MRVFHGHRHVQQLFASPVITIGNFDGVHRGHQEILRRAQESARARKGVVIAYTFRPHPQVALRPDRQIALLATYDEKLELLSQAGADVVIEEPFSREFSTTSAETFFSEVLIRGLHAAEIVVGYDFAFGREREGELSRLKELCAHAGVALTIVAPERVETPEGPAVASSSSIRQALARGNVALAHALLGRPFFYRGVVVKGEGRGRKIGFPTANQKIENKLALPFGVYATRSVLNGRTLPSVTNVGVRPTFFPAEAQELPVLVETHVLEEVGDIYGQTLDVQFLGYVRSEQRFNGIEELKAQIRKDCDRARSLSVS